LVAPQRLLKFAATNGKPFLLLMPKYVQEADYYLPALAMAENDGHVQQKKQKKEKKKKKKKKSKKKEKRRNSTSELTVDSAQSNDDQPLFLCPRQRYDYWTPQGMRPDDGGLEAGTVSKTKPQKGGKGNQKPRSCGLGVRTSPFVSMWYVRGTPCIDSDQLLEWWRNRGGVAGAKDNKLKEGVAEKVGSKERQGQNEQHPNGQNEQQPTLKLCRSLDDLPSQGWAGGGGRY
jgi:hypothetical protein